MDRTHLKILAEIKKIHNLIALYIYNKENHK
jgi:hypothetical protein